MENSQQYTTIINQYETTPIDEENLNFDHDSNDDQSGGSSNDYSTSSDSGGDDYQNYQYNDGESDTNEHYNDQHSEVDFMDDYEFYEKNRQLFHSAQDPNEEIIFAYIRKLFTACSQDNIKSLQTILDERLQMKGIQIDLTQSYLVAILTPYNLPKHSELSQLSNFSLLDAAVLSNSPQVIELIITTMFGTNTQQNTRFDQIRPLSLIIALVTRKMNSVEYLTNTYQFDFSRNYRYLADCLECIAYFGDLTMTRYLIDTFQVDQYFVPNSQHYLLHNAVHSRNYDLISYILSLETIVDINGYNFEYESVLLDPVCDMQWEMVRFLLERNANPTDVFSDATILHHAVRDNYITIDMINYLIHDIGIDVENEEIDDGLRAIHIAAEQGNLLILKHLIEECNADPHVVSPFGLNLFHCAATAAEDCTVELIDYIATLGIDINAADGDDKRSQTPLGFALQHVFDLDIITTFIKHGSKPTFYTITDDSDNDINTINDETYYTIGNVDDIIYKCHLCYSVQYQRPEIVEFLLQSCTNITTGKMKQLLIIATLWDNYDILKLLFTKFNASAICSQTNLNLVKIWCSSQHTQLQTRVCEYLINLGIFNLNDRFHEDQNTILFKPIQNNLPPIISYWFINAGADIHAINSLGCNILHIIAQTNYTNQTMFRLLYTQFCDFVQHGVDIHAVSHSGKGVLHYSAEYSDIEFISELIDHFRLPLTLRDNTLSTPLHYATRQSVELLCTKENINIQDENGCTALMISLQRLNNQTHNDKVPIKYTKLSETLIALNADVNVCNYELKSPLHVALECSITPELSLIKTLVNNGANVELCCYENDIQTPLFHFFKMKNLSKSIKLQFSKYFVFDIGVNIFPQFDSIINIPSNRKYNHKQKNELSNENNIQSKVFTTTIFHHLFQLDASDDYILDVVDLFIEFCSKQ